MARKLTAAELGKTARNLKRIESFLGARCEWALDQVGRRSFASLRTAADKLAFTIGQRTLALGIESRVIQPEPPEQVPPETFDAELLGRFATFIGQLDLWFVERPGAVPEQGAGRFLAEIQHSLEKMRRALTLIKEGQESDEPPGAVTDDQEGADDIPADEPAEPVAELDPAPAAAPRRAPTSSVDDIYAGTRDESGKAPSKPPEQIAFTASDVDPMFSWVGPNTVDLTPLGRQRVEELFEEQGVSFFRYQLENFSDEIKKRIENAPDGHVLVVKVRTIGDERRPFLSYVAEVALPRSEQ